MITTRRTDALAKARCAAQAKAYCAAQKLYSSTRAVQAILRSSKVTQERAGYISHSSGYSTYTAQANRSAHIAQAIARAAHRLWLDVHVAQAIARAAQHRLYNSSCSSSYSS